MSECVNKLDVFQNPEFGSIRVVELDGEPWLVGKDVATALGYSNPRDALAKHVDPEDKGVAKCDTPSGEQDMTIINESGLYSLVLSSKLPTARKFRRWVTSEVLPSIRRNGFYAANSSVLHLVENMNTQFTVLNEQLSSMSHSVERLAAAVESQSRNPTPALAPAATAAAEPSRYSKAMSPWRANMYSIAKPLARRMNITIKQLMTNIYKQMRTEYSWDFLTEKKKYILNHGESKDLSTIDVIEDSEMYSSIFMAILKDVYTANTLETPEWHEINAGDVALAPVEASAVEAPAHDRRCKADNIPWCDKVSKAINDFAVLRGDKTANHMATYRMVFNALDKSKVDAIRARYVKRYGLPKRSAQIFNSKQRAQMIFDAIEALKVAM